MSEKTSFEFGHGYTAVIYIDGSQWKLKRKLGGRLTTMCQGSIKEDDTELTSLMKNARQGTPVESLRFSLALRRATLAYNSRTMPAKLPTTPEG